MRHHTKLRDLEYIKNAIIRTCNLTGDIETLANISELTTLTALKNLNPVFDLQKTNKKLFNTYMQTLKNYSDDKEVLKERLHKLASQKQFAGFARTCADGTKQLKYGLYIYAGIPHSSLSVANCKEGKLHHTGTSLSSYSDRSNFIELDKEFFKMLIDLELEPKAITKIVSDEVAETLTEEEQIKIELDEDAQAELEAERLAGMTDAEILADMTIE